MNAEAGALPTHRRHHPAAGLVLAASSMCVLLLAPVAYLLLRAAEADASGWELILRPRTAWLAVRSLGLAGAVTMAAVAIGVPLAWLTVRTDLPLRRFWGVAGSLPLVIPSYVSAFILLAALGPGGLAEEVLAPLGMERLPRIAGFPGAFLALTLCTYPYVYLLVAGSLRGQDPALEEVGRTLGRSRWQVFRTVTLPLLRPSIAAGGLLVALYTLHDFGAVSLMRFQTFTQAIFLQYRGAFDRAPAAILSLILVVLALAVLAIEQRSRGRARYFRTAAGSATPPSPIPLGRWRFPALAFCGLTAAVGFFLPVTVLLVWLIRGLGPGLEVAVAVTAAVGSVSASAAGATATLVAALPIAILTARHPGAWARTVERLAYSGFALPGIVVALALVFFGANLVPALYQTLPLMVLAYMIMFLPQASEPLRGALLQVSPRVEEAGRALGRSRFYVFGRVLVPLVSRGAMIGYSLVFLTAMKELPATLLLRPTGFETLATRVWTAASVSRFSEAALPALALLLLSAAPLSILARRVQVQEVRSE